MIACITVSLVTPDRKKKDYVGFGFGAQALFDKKKHKMTGEYVGEKFLNILFEEPDSIDCVEQISTMEDYSSGHGCLKLINDMNGYSNTWYSKKGDTIFHNQMYYLEDPDCKNKIHCVCFTYDQNRQKYMNQNLAEVFGELGLINIAYPDDATKAFEPHDVNIKIDESDTEFGAKTFEKVVMIIIRIMYIW